MILPYTPIYDRTIDDIYQRTVKAFFNVSDWNRIRNNILHLRGYLSSNFDWSPIQEVPPEADKAFIPQAKHIQDFANCINELRMEYSLVSQGWQPIYLTYTGGKNGDGNKLDYEELNRWELDLEITARIISGIISMWTFSGDAGQQYFCGDWKRGGLI